MIQYKNYCLFLLLVFLYSCNNYRIQYTTEIIDNLKVREIKGTVINRGETDLTVSNDLIILDSIYALVDLSNDGDIFRSYHLRTGEKYASAGNRGNGKNEFLMPISYCSDNQKANSFDVFDINLGRLSNIYMRKDSLHIIQDVMPALLTHSFISGKVGNTFYATKLDNADGLYYISISDSLFRWVEYSSDIDKKISSKHNLYSSMYNNIICASKKGVAVAFRFINKILFYTPNGNLVKEVQIGKDAMHPTWDELSEDIDYSTAKIFFLRMCITEQYIYALQYDDNINSEKRQYSLVHVFDWDFKYQHTLRLDSFAGSLKVDKTDSFMLTLVDDGTGLTDVIRYDLPIVK